MNHTTVVEQPDMAERATITIHTTPETRERLERLAAATRRSKSFLGNEALERYLAAEEEFVAGVQEGIRQADAGQLFTGEEVKDFLHRQIDQVAKRQAQ